MEKQEKKEQPPQAELTVKSDNNKGALISEKDVGPPYVYLIPYKERMNLMRNMLQRDTL